MTHKQSYKKRWKYHSEYRIKNRKRLRAATRKWAKIHKEYITVRTHHDLIFNSKFLNHKRYEGMPFYNAWNPSRGGSYKAGATWIIENLGKRPNGTWLHIIEHAKGFVPGNLEWTYPVKQSNQQMFKIIAQLRHRIKALEIKLRKKVI